MELQISQEKENALFGRKEIKGTVNAEKTPSRQEILRLIREKFSVPEINIKIKKIVGRFGSREFKVEANIYDSAEEKEKLEIKKKKEIEIEKKSAEKVQEATAEKSAEEEKSPEIKAEPAEIKQEEKTEVKEQENTENA